MVLRLLALLWMMFYSGTAIGQLEQSTAGRLGAKSVKTYIFSVSGEGVLGDSILSKEVHFDSLGWIDYKIEKGRSSKYTRYDYKYEEGKLKTINSHESFGYGIVTYYKYKYTDEGLLKETVVYDGRGVFKRKVINKYFGERIKGQVVKYRGGGKSEKIGYLYNEEGQVIKRISNGENRYDLEFQYTEKGDKIAIYILNEKNEKELYKIREYDDEERMIMEKVCCDRKFRIPNLSLKLYAEKGDIWTSKIEYNEQGLRVKTTQWLGNVLIGMRKFNYEF